MTQAKAPNTRVEEGVGSYEGQFFGYAKRDVRDDPDDLYTHRYDEVGPFKTKEEAQDAADKAFSKLEKANAKNSGLKNAAYEEGGAGLRLRELREAAGDDADRLPDTGEVL